MNSDPLQTENAALRQKVQEQGQALAQAQREITLLRQKLDALARRFFGKKSEQLSQAQLELLLSGLAGNVVEMTPEEMEPPARLAPPRSASHPQGLRTPENLEVVRQVIEPAVVLTCLLYTSRSAPRGWLAC